LTRRSLPDLNVLIALTDPDHEFNSKAREWFASRRGVWGLCPFTEAGYLRITTNPAIHRAVRSLEQSKAILQSLKGFADHLYWEITASWVELTARFASRIQGHQQVTDAYLLGLAIQEDGVLVTFDKGLRFMAGAEFSRNLLILD
jgi:toxin-antitoxin system PIN domain toxin